MAKATLPTNYRDDILNVSTEGKRKYRMNYNDDGTVSFVDVTPYDQEGSDFGAGDINATNEAVNQSADKGKIIDDPDTAEATTEEGYISGVQLFNHLNQSLAKFMEYMGYDPTSLALIPTMDSNSQNNYVISGSALYNSSFDYYMAFDNNPSSATIVKASGSDYWLKVQLPSAKKVKKLTLTLYSGDAPTSCSFKLQGSNDNSTWKDVATISGQAVTSEQTFTFENGTSYKYYRLYTTTPSHYSSVAKFYYIGFSGVQLYGE